MKQALFNFGSNMYPGSPNARIEGSLYLSEGDFAVFEIDMDGSCCDEEREENFDHKKPFVECTLSKRGISTFEAIRQIALIMGLPTEKIKASGLKDTFGVTAQNITLPSKEYLQFREKLAGEHFSLGSPRSTDTERIIAHIQGNRFRITVREIQNSDAQEKILAAFSDYLQKGCVPNYYGHQRFGYNQDNHLIGERILKEFYEEATKILLTNTLNETEGEQEIKKRLAENWGDWNQCLELLENAEGDFSETRNVLAYLENAPQDFLGALQETKKFSFFIDSYNSSLFNKILLKLVNEELPIPEKLPMLGPETIFEDPDIESMFETLLATDGLSRATYKKHPQKERIRGRERKTHYAVKNFSYMGTDPLIISFDLPIGVYANLLLDRIIQNRNEHKVN